MRLRFAEANVSCARCDVREECNASAVYYGDAAFSVRGGISPYERPDVRVGRTMATPDLIEAERLRGRERAWNRFLQGLPLSELEEGHEKHLAAMKRAIAAGPHTATWRAQNSGDVSGWEAGAGGAISQDKTRSAVKVMYLTGGRLVCRVLSSRHVVYDDDITPKELRKWPEGVDTIGASSTLETPSR